MRSIATLRLFGLGAAVLCLALAAPALARGTYQLRALDFDISTGNSFNSFVGHDNFNNGDPYTGLFYAAGAGGTSHAGGYLANGFTAGAELNGPAPDFAGQQFGVGSLAFRYADAIDATNNLTPASYQQRSLTLQPAQVPNTALGFANRNAGFTLLTFWDFVRPDRGSFIQLALAGTSTGIGSTGTSNYTDRLRVRLLTDYQSGETAIAFEKLTRTDGLLTLTTLERHPLSSLGLDLSTVDYIALQLSRDLPSAGATNPAVHASVFFADAAVDAMGEPVILRAFDFQTSATSFENGQFSSVFTAAAWLNPDPAQAVPEPGGLAMMLAGLALTGALLRRRRAPAA